MKDILERLVSGELDVDEAEKLLKANNILEFDDIAKVTSKELKEQVFQKRYFHRARTMRT